MIPLNRQIGVLESIVERLDQKIDSLQNRMDAIEEKAADHDRDLTAREQERFDRLLEEQEELDAERSDVQSALDYLSEYYSDEE